MAKSRVIVIGAGIAGLVAAHDLQKAGISATVLESSGRPGGRMASERINNCIIDTGAQFLSSGYPILSGLIHELNMETEFIRTSPFCGIVREGHIHSFRYDRPFSLLASRLLRFSDWLRLGIKGMKLYRKIRPLPANDYSAWHRFDNKNCLEWSSSCYGKEITEYLIEPMLEAFYFQKPEDTSRALFIAISKFTHEKSKTMTLKGGMASLPDRLAANLRILYNSPVESISVRHGSVIISGDGREYTAEKVILAIPAHVAAAIFDQAGEVEKKVLATRYSATITISLGVKGNRSWKSREKIYGLWLPRRERANIAAVAIESNKNRDRAAAGELLNIMLSGSAGKKMMPWEEKEIISTVLRELSLYFPGIANDITFTRIFRWPYAEPMSPVGRSRNLKDYRANLPEGSRVILAGDYMGMPFTEGAAETGRWAASKIIRAKQ